MDVELISIPDFVVMALQEAEEQLPPDVIEPDTVLTFVHLFGHDDACDWIRAHREMYFQALKQASASLPHLPWA
jgi:hypothetical protein